MRRRIRERSTILRRATEAARISPVSSSRAWLGSTSCTSRSTASRRPLVPSLDGIVAPAATPHDIIARLQTEITGALSQPDVREKLAALGAEPIGNTPAEFATMITVETAKWGKI